MFKPGIDSSVVIYNTRQKIISNLETLKLSKKSIDRIMAAVDKMPGKDHVMGALKFLTEITAKKGQREEWYTRSDLLAEYFCTLSNIGFFAVGFYYNDWFTLCAATFSALSHAIPLQRLHELDIAAALAVFAYAASHYAMLVERPDVLLAGAGTLTIGLLDLIVTRNYLDKVGASFHVAWHIAASCALFHFNQIKVELSQTHNQQLLEGINQSVIPGFLQTYFNAISESISNYAGNYSSANSCTIS